MAKMSIRQNLKGKIDSKGAMFVIIGLCGFLVYWTVRSTQNVSAISDNVQLSQSEIKMLLED